MKSFACHCADQIGRKAKGKTAEDIAAHHKVPLGDIEDALHIGTKVEMEHTTSKAIAFKIAMDHLWEDPKYYTKLKKVEEDAPVNNVGSGNIAGIRPGEAPPVRQTRFRDPMKRYRTMIGNFCAGGRALGPNQK